MKYVMLIIKPPFKDAIEHKVPIIFPDFLVHADAYKWAKVWFARDHRITECKVVSAGFIDLAGRRANGKFSGGLRVYGESESLGLKSDPEDGRTIETYQYTHGIV